MMPRTLSSRQRGVSVMAAIFLLMLMASLAAVMARMISATNIDAAADIAGSRAYLAARAGVEWAMYQLDPNAAEANIDNIACPGGGPSIPNHSLFIQCTVYPTTGHYTEGGKSIRIFRIVATATASGLRAPGGERQVEVTVEKCRDSAITAPPYDCQ